MARLVALARRVVIGKMVAVACLVAGAAWALDGQMPGADHPVSLDGLVGALIGGAMSFGAIRQRVADHDQRIRETQQAVSLAHQRIDSILRDRAREAAE